MQKNATNVILDKIAIKRAGLFPSPVFYNLQSREEYSQLLLGATNGSIVLILCCWKNMC